MKNQVNPTDTNTAFDSFSDSDLKALLSAGGYFMGVCPWRRSDGSFVNRSLWNGVSRDTIIKHVRKMYTVQEATFELDKIKSCSAQYGTEIALS